MSKLYITEDLISREVLPNIRKAINAIERANKINLTIPRNFRYVNYLRNLFDDNYNDKRVLSNIETMLNSSLRNYKNIKENNLRLVNSIASYKIFPSSNLIQK